MHIIQVMPESVAQSAPLDIVREIFKHFSTRLTVLDSGSTHQFPWYLGHICSSWRAVFLSMHREFWSEIQFDEPYSEESEERFTQITESFLKHGQNFPISFKFLEDIPFLPVLSALMAQSERWQDVSFHSLLSNTSLSINNRLPLLRSLTINHIENLDEPDIFKDAPNLTRLTLTTISKWNFNWPSLTIFELTSARICHHFVYALSQMENLEKLLVKQVEDPDFFDDTIEPEGTDVILPRLKVLATVGFMFCLLLVIKTPVLEELYIDVTHLAGQEPYGVCPYIFQKSPCHRLNRLTVHTCDDMFVEDVVHYTPHVQFLTVVLPDGGRDGLYNCLTCSQGQAPLLPVMQQLCMYCPAVDLDLAFDELRVMVESRTNPINQCLKELVLVFVDPDMLTPFSEAVQPICELNHVQFRAEVFDEDEDLALSFLHG